MLKNYTQLCDSLLKSENHVEANLKYAMSRAHAYKKFIGGSSVTFEDLVSAANYGLIKAAEKYDPNRKIKFISYAVHWIDKYIKEYLSERVIRIPASQSGKLAKVKKVIKNFSDVNKREPTIEELTKITAMRELSVRKTIVGEVESVVSLNDISEMDESLGGTFEKMFMSEELNPEEAYDDGLKNSLIGDMLSSLEKIEYDVVNLYFFENHKFVKISKKLNISYNDTRDILTRAVQKLKTKFTDIGLCA